MKSVLIYLILASLGVLVFMSGCGKGELSIDESYAHLRPVKQLELPDQVTENLVVTISNVADQGSSYKNHIDLKINGKHIRPDWSVSNVQNTYTYSLKLRPGYYKIKAEYYAYIGWGEEKYTIETYDLVQVHPDQVTKLNAHIAKKPNGAPVDNKMYFDVSKKPIPNLNRQGRAVQRTQRTAESSSPPAPAPAPVSEPIPQKVEQPIQNMPQQPKQVNNQTIVLQINTIPGNADIIIDDQVVGQSPIRIPVNRLTDHIVQVSADGYKTGIKFLEHSIFANKSVHHVILELENLK